MASATAQHVKDHPFTQGTRQFVARVFFEPDQQRIDVEVFEGNQRVVFTYPDGAQAIPTFTVTLMTAIDLARVHGLGAVGVLLEDAEEQVSRWA